MSVPRPFFPISRQEAKLEGAAGLDRTRHIHWKIGKLKELGTFSDFSRVKIVIRKWPAVVEIECGFAIRHRRIMMDHGHVPQETHLRYSDRCCRRGPPMEVGICPLYLQSWWWR